MSPDFGQPERDRPEPDRPEPDQPEPGQPEPDQPLAVEGVLPASEPVASIDDVVGYIDGIAVRRISGWAANRSRLDERLVVRIHLDGAVIGEGMADRPRSDLERNGLGDGAYGFDIEPIRPVPQLDRIRISASARRAGAEDTDDVPLENLIARKLASQSPGEGFAAVTTRLQQVLDESRTLQRRTDHALRLIAAELKDMRERAESTPPAASDTAAGEGLPDAIAAIREAQADLTRQLAEVGVIQARIDASLAGIQGSGPAAPNSGDDRSLRRLVTVLTGVSGVALGLGVLSLFV